MQPFFLLAALVAVEPVKPFAITVVDAQTGRGVPLIELATVHHVRLVTDSNGIVAFAEPGLMNQTVFFHVFGHGYEFPKDGFGYRGKQVDVTPGGSVTLKVNRINIAERLYRVTGAGIYRDSVLVGAQVPTKEPLLNAQVLGSDSVMNAVYKGRLWWFWGDTLRPGYPLGNFHVPGATSELPGHADVGVDLNYFVDAKGFAKKTCEMPGQGPTWLTSLVVLPDAKGRERLYGSFVKVEPPLKVYSRGLVVWDDDKQQFEKLRDVDMKLSAFPSGQAIRHGEYVYFATPFPLLRMKATADAFGDPAQWEALANVDGRLTWRTNPSATERLTPNQGALRIRDRDSGKPISAHAGSIAWNDYRKRWTMLFVEHNGKPSFLGEVWYAEADELTGPWRYAVKVATHDRMSFYNPKQHPEFAKDNGKVIYFEGTYTHDFSGNPDATPRYEYNQLMYRLDLSDVRTALPRPVPGKDFLALDRRMAGTVPVPGEPGFYMLAEDKEAAAATVPLKGGNVWPK